MLKCKFFCDPLYPASPSAIKLTQVKEKYFNKAFLIS